MILGILEILSRILGILENFKKDFKIFPEGFLRFLGFLGFFTGVFRFSEGFLRFARIFGILLRIFPEGFLGYFRGFLGFSTFN